jgi:hypothetical protein
MSRRKKCEEAPCRCGRDAISLKEILKKLREKTAEISQMEVKSSADLLKFDKLKSSITDKVNTLESLIADTEKSCNLDLEDLKYVNSNMNRWVFKENWYALSKLVDNATDLFEEDLHGQCYEQEKELEEEKKIKLIIRLEEIPPEEAKTLLRIQESTGLSLDTIRELGNYPSKELREKLEILERELESEEEWFKKLPKL